MSPRDFMWILSAKREETEQAQQDAEFAAMRDMYDRGELGIEF